MSNATNTFSLIGSASPFYLFVDNNQNIYYSSYLSHTVTLVRANSSNMTIVAGTDGVYGSNDTQFSEPYGIFVDQVESMYVADCRNHRIMKWYQGASTGIRVAGNGISGSSSTQLDSPTDIIVDTNEYMYISESGNARITRWAPNSTFGVCIAACHGMSGSTPTQLHGPHSLAFDSQGSLYVTDWANNRVQKFPILNYYSTYSVL